MLYIIQDKASFTVVIKDKKDLRILTFINKRIYTNI